MYFEKVKPNPNPWNRANFLSRILFWWITPLFQKGWKGNLKLDDIYDCPAAESSEIIGEAIQKQWDKELEKMEAGNQCSLTRAIICTFAPKVILHTFLFILSACFIKVVQAILLGYTVQRIAQLPFGNTYELYLCAAGMCCLITIQPFLVQHASFGVLRVSMRICIACRILVYKKALKLNQTALTATSVGQMVNLLSNDVSKFERSGIVLPFLIVCPIQLVVIICVLWMYMGCASLTCLFLLIPYMPIQMVIGKLFTKLRMKTALLTDERISLMSEIISGMRVIKMYGWEIPFTKLVSISRRKEIQKIRRAVLLRSTSLTTYFTSPKVIMLMLVAVFVLGMQGDLTPDKVFACLLLVNALSYPMTFAFPQAITFGAEALTSLKRIQNFLLLEEQTETLSLDANSKMPESDACKVVMRNVTASWKKEGVQTLRNITLTVNPGELLAVVGPVGCGKTSLLLTILSELPILSGKANVRGRLAYASQDPWIFGGSIRQNIIFGGVFDDVKYRKVLHLCALQKDIDMLPYGDKTIVGDRGVKLSGGQKARVNLARAVYLDADVYLLDDPLSAVDLSVSKHIFEECINGYLKDKIRILVTHQMQFLKRASQILMLKDGMCLGAGTYQEMTDSAVDLGSVLENQENEQRNLLASVPENKMLLVDKLLNDSSQNFDGKGSVNEKNDGKTINADSDKAPKSPKEKKVYGTVKTEVYKTYLKSGAGPFFGFITLVTIIMAQVFYNGADVWLTKWTSMVQNKNSIKDCYGNLTKTHLNETDYYGNAFRRNLQDVFPVTDERCLIITQNYTLNLQNTDNDVDTEFQLTVYGGLIVILIVLSVLRVTAYLQICMRASVTLHNNLFQSILRSPVAFFDINPIGIILNRVSQDLGVIDDVIPFTSSDVFEILVSAMGSMAVASIVNPYLLIPVFLLIVGLIYLLLFFLSTARDVKRYEGITLSPVLSLLSTSLTGLTTIRAFKAQKYFQASFEHHQNQYTATSFAYLSVTHWFTNTVEILCVLFTMFVTVAMVVFSDDPSNASKAGLAIASVMQVLSRLQLGLKQSADLESQMTSVERVLEFINLKPEAALESPAEKRPPKNWPFSGHIEYQNVFLRYAPDEKPVLKDLTFKIYPGEKIGIVGRTGAGKSSVIASLFRMAEPEGKILIDGVCIQDIGLNDLRKRITIIPQDPILYTGTVRKNLDPFSECSDNELWKALEKAFLKEYVQTLPGGLDTTVSDNGSNFSVGQRQLICLARAILKKNRILVLDEATANIDINTDTLIQETIRNRFDHCTVITIAHRLHNVIESDRVMVLDGGRLKEFDEPYKLLENSDSLLSQVLQTIEPAMAMNLRNKAYEIHYKNLVKIRNGSNDNKMLAVKDICDLKHSIYGSPPDEDSPNCHANEAYEDTQITHL